MFRSLILLCLLVSLLASGSPLRGQETVRIQGTDVMAAQLMPMLVEQYRKQKSGTRFEISGGGSDSAFAPLLEGTADIGLSVRNIRPEEATRFAARKIALKQVVAVYDAVAIIVHKDNPISALTVDQVKALFTGGVTNWRHLGGLDQPVRVYHWNTKMASSKAFQNMAMEGGNYPAGAQAIQDRESPVTLVGAEPAGISFVGMAYSNGDNVKVVRINGRDLDPLNAAAYPYLNEMYYFTRKEVPAAVQAFITWATSSTDAQAVVSQFGLYLPKVQVRTP